MLKTIRRRAHSLATARTWTCFFCKATNDGTERCTACGV